MQAVLLKCSGDTKAIMGSCLPSQGTLFRQVQLVLQDHEAARTRKAILTLLLYAILVMQGMARFR